MCKGMFCQACSDMSYKDFAIKVLGLSPYQVDTIDQFLEKRGQWIASGRCGQKATRDAYTLFEIVHSVEFPVRVYFETEEAGLDFCKRFNIPSECVEIVEYSKLNLKGSSKIFIDEMEA